MSLRTIMTHTRFQFLIFPIHKNSACSLCDIDDLTVSLMRVHADGCSRYQFSVDNAVLLIMEHFGVKRFLPAFKVWEFFIFLLVIIKIHCSFLFSFLFFTQYLDNRIYHSKDDHGIHYGIRFRIRYDVKIHKNHTD